MNTLKMTHIHQKLFNWWRKEGRLLPWRQRSSAKLIPKEVKDTTVLVLREKAFQSYFAGHLLRDPYRVVVSELMLQQTQVDRVLPKYQNWMTKWPSIFDLAQATLAEVLIFWQGLGYNRRARFLWLLAKNIVEEQAGIWPKTEEELLKLPGIGKYTARAILSFSMGQQVGVVDTNVRRILQRLFGDGGSKKTNISSEKELFNLADQILPLNQADPWNQALMDFGALICTSKNPKCPICPLKNDCLANQKAIQRGYMSYAEYLKTTEIGKKLLTKNTPKKIRFADTDRYFRGRIMDELRQKSSTTEQLLIFMRGQYGLDDKKRFEKLITNLIQEGLVHRRKNVLNIGE